MTQNIELLAYKPAMAAAVANVSRPTLYRWMRMDGFPVARIGGCTRIPAQAFKEWLEQQAGVTKIDPNKGA